MNPPDPLADPLAASSAASSPAVASPDEVAASAAPPRKSRLGLILGLFVLLAGGGVIAVGGWWWLNAVGAGGPVAAGGPAGSPVRPELPAPPPPFAAQLAALTGDAGEAQPPPSLDGTISSLPKLAASLAPQLQALPVDPTAPPRLIVAAGGQPSAGDNSTIPRHERWEVQFPPGNTIESYTRQMDFFRIEMGIIGGSDQVIYLSNLSEPVPAKRTGPAADEQRLYLVWRRGDMRQADDQLAVRAQVPLTGKVVAHFCPPELEAMLAAVEDAQAAKLNVTKIRRTTFGIRSRGGNVFEFYVTELLADPT